MGVILRSDRVIHTKMSHEKFMGSSSYRYCEKTNSIILKKRKSDHISKVGLKTAAEMSSFERECSQEYLRVRKARINEASLEASLSTTDVKKPKKYKLNKNKVRDKCNALFGLKASRKFMAFITVSFPFGFSSNDARTCLNTVLTRCRDDFKLKTYLRVTEYQKSGTIHFHIVTNCYMPIYQLNRYMAVAIENTIKKNNIETEGLQYIDKKGISRVTQAFDIKKYNGVDVKRCDNNKKKLNQYLTKYVSKNNDTFDILPYHCSRDISELFVSESFKSRFCTDYTHISKTLYHVSTLVVDNDYCSIEFFNQKQDNGKYFNTPDSWFWLLHKINNMVYDNHHSKVKHEKLPLI